MAVMVCLVSSSAESRIYTSFANIAEKSIRGVVNIRTTEYSGVRDKWLDPYQFFLGGRMPRSRPNHSLGSGVVISQNGDIVTNYHVIKNATKIDVLFADKTKLRAEVVGSDRKTDLALLKVKPRKGLVNLEFGNSDQLRVGDIVLAIGNPFGFNQTVTSGIISAKGRVIGNGPYDSFLQTDASIHPGNSGGPLVDIRGRVIGINTAVSSEGHGIGFAIPSNMVKQVIKDLRRFGKVNRPWLGVVGLNILSRDDLDDAYDPTGVYGVLVENLIVDGPAYSSGLQIGDLILSLGKKKVHDTGELQRLLSLLSPGETAVLKIYRRGRGFMNITIKLQSSPRPEDLPEEKDLF